MRRLDTIDLRLLRVFVTLVEAGGFGGAQIVLNLSQSTLSTHLAELEGRIGATLCVRGRRGFRLTDAGQATFEAAKRLFEDMEVFRQRVGSATGARVGRLRLGVVDGVVTSPALGLQEAIRRFCEPGSDVFVDLALATPHDLEAAVLDGRRDLVIGPLSQRAPGLVYRPTHRERQSLYCGRGHPLYDVADAEIDQAAIARAAFSLRSYRQLEDLHRVGHPRASGSVVHMEAQTMMILSGRFIGFLPAHVAEPWVGRGEMRALRPRTYDFLSTHHVAYRRADADRPLVRGFLDALAPQMEG